MGRGELFRLRSPEGPSKKTLRVTAPCMMFDISGRPQTRSLSCPLVLQCVFLFLINVTFHRSQALRCFAFDGVGGAQDFLGGC